MAGKKGCSGRKGRIWEKSIHELTEKCILYLLNNFEKFDDYKKVTIALTMAGKVAPQQIDHSGNVTIELSDKMKEARQRFIPFIPVKTSDAVMVAHD